MANPRTIPPGFFCPITRDIMTDPVTIVETGRTYERAAIMRTFEDQITTWADRHGGYSNFRFKDPMGVFLQNAPYKGILRPGGFPALFPNRALQEVIEEWKKNDAPATPAAENKEVAELQKRLEEQLNMNNRLAQRLAQLDAQRNQIEEVKQRPRDDERYFARAHQDEAVVLAYRRAAHERQTVNSNRVKRLIAEAMQLMAEEKPSIAAVIEKLNEASTIDDLLPENNHQLHFDLYFNLTKAYLLQKNLRQANISLGKAKDAGEHFLPPFNVPFVPLPQHNRDDYIKLARFAALQGLLELFKNPASAIHLLKKANAIHDLYFEVELIPEMLHSKVLLGIALLANNSFNEAKTQFELAKTLQTPGTHHSLLEIGLGEISRLVDQDYAAAKGHYETALNTEEAKQEDLTAILAHNGLGTIAFVQDKNYAVAYAHLNQVINHCKLQGEQNLGSTIGKNFKENSYSIHAWAYLLRARYYAQVQDIPKALADYDFLLDMLIGYNNLETIRSYPPAIQDALATRARMLGEFPQHLNRIKFALATAEKILEINNDHVEALTACAALKCAGKKYFESLKDYNKLIDEQKQNRHYGRARVYMYLNQPEKALSDWQITFAKNVSTHAYCKMAREDIYQFSNKLIQDKAYQEAADLLKKTLVYFTEADANYGAILANLSIASLQSGNLAEGIKNYSLLLSSNVGAHRHIDNANKLFLDMYQHTCTQPKLYINAIAMGLVIFKHKPEQRSAISIAFLAMAQDLYAKNNSESNASKKQAMLEHIVLATKNILSINANHFDALKLYADANRKLLNKKPLHLDLANHDFLKQSSDTYGKLITLAQSKNDKANEIIYRGNRGMVTLQDKSLDWQTYQDLRFVLANQESCPSTIAAYLSVIAGRKRDFQSSLEFARLAITKAQKKNEHPTAILMLGYYCGDALRQLGQYSEAETYFLKISQHTGVFESISAADNLGRLAECSIELDKLEVAREVLAKAMKLVESGQASSSAAAFVYAQQGRLHLKENKSSEAAESFKKALALDPTQDYALANQGSFSVSLSTTAIQVAIAMEEKIDAPLPQSVTVQKTESTPNKEESTKLRKFLKFQSRVAPAEENKVDQAAMTLTLNGSK